MDHYRKLVVRSLQKTLAKLLLHNARAHGHMELLQDFKVHNELLLREALGEKTLRSYLRALGFATRKPISYNNSMTVGDLIQTISKA